MPQQRRSTSEAAKSVRRMREVVDEGADTAERIHKEVANLPLDLMQRLHLFEGTAKELQKVQDRSIGAVYDVVRGVNREVNRLARRVLLAPPAGRSTRPRRGARKTMPARRTDAPAAP